MDIEDNRPAPRKSTLGRHPVVECPALTSLPTFVDDILAGRVATSPPGGIVTEESAMESNGRTPDKPHNRGGFRRLPAWLLVALFAAQGFLFLSERFHWFVVGERKGSAVAVVCSWMSVRVQEAKRQREVVEKSSAAYYDIDQARDGEEMPRTVSWSQLKTMASQLRSPPTWREDLLGVDFVTDVVFVDTCYLASRFPGEPALTDEDMESLCRLSELRVLRIDCEWSRISDAGLKHLRRLPNLRKLTLVCGPQASTVPAGLRTALLPCREQSRARLRRDPSASLWPRGTCIRHWSDASSRERYPRKTRTDEQSVPPNRP
jgi:hypothetical protein